MFTLANMFHLFAHKFAGLSGRRLSFLLILSSPLDRFFFWHNKKVTRPKTSLDGFRFD